MRNPSTLESPVRCRSHASLRSCACQLDGYYRPAMRLWVARRFPCTSALERRKRPLRVETSLCLTTHERLHPVFSGPSSHRAKKLKSQIVTNSTPVHRRTSDTTSQAEIQPSKRMRSQSKAHEYPPTSSCAWPERYRHRNRGAIRHLVARRAAMDSLPSHGRVTRFRTDFRC